MEAELKFIMDLMDNEIDIETLRKIRDRIDKTKNKEHVEEIKENKKIPVPAAFMVSSKTIKVNNARMLDYLIRLESAMKIDMPETTDEELQLIKLITIYRIYMHELYHSKQIYDAFDTDKTDIETEITRSLYNIDRKVYLEELKTKSRKQIIEEKTYMTNSIFYNHPEINILDRKADIETLKYVRNMLSPVKDSFENVDTYLYLLKLSLLINGYDKPEVPYIETLEKLKILNKKFNIVYPYNSKNKFMFLSAIKEITTEKERFELGLDVSQQTIENTYQKIDKILGY